MNQARAGKLLRQLTPSMGLRLLFASVFLFWGAYGNYFPVYLRAAEWDGATIGWIGGMRNIALVALPLLWGFLTDRWGRPVSMLQLLVAASALAFTPALLTADPAVILPMILLFGCFSVGTVPTLDALTLRHVAHAGGDYGRYRIWGSAGFIVGGFVMGGLIAATSRASVPLTLVLMLAVPAVLALFLAPVRYTHGDRTPIWPTVRRVLADPQVRAFYLVSFVNRAAAHGLMLFLPLHLGDIGVSDAVLPVYWTVGVIAEMALFRVAPKLCEIHGHGRVIAACCGVAVVQYGLMGVVLDPWALLPILLGHGVTFGLWYYASVTWLGSRVADADRTTAQGLFQSLGFGVGGTAASIGAGYLFAAGGGPLLFTACAALQLVNVALALWVFRARPAVAG